MARPHKMRSATMRELYVELCRLAREAEAKAAAADEAIFAGGDYPLMSSTREQRIAAEALDYAAQGIRNMSKQFYVKPRRKKK